MVPSLSCAKLGPHLSPRLFLFFFFNSSLDILIKLCYYKKDKLGRKWAKFKFSLVTIVDEVEVKVEVWMDGGGGWVCAVFNKINAMPALIKVGVKVSAKLGQTIHLDTIDTLDLL